MSYLRANIVLARIHSSTVLPLVQVFLENRQWRAQTHK